MVSLPAPHRNLLADAWGIASVEKFAEAARQIAGLSAEEIEAAQEECRRPGDSGRIGEVLLRQGLLSPRHYLEILDRLHAPEEPGVRKVGRYRLLREIARGGMGIVYEADDPELKRRVALKVLRHGDAAPETVRRLHREASIAAQLRHANIVTVHEVGVAEGPEGEPTHFIAMDYIEGPTLAALMGEGRTAKPELMRMLEEVARAVGHAHEKGIVHRDLKPANVLVERGGRVMLTDFGLAKAESFVTKLTGTNELLGTPQYMAPEQAEGRVREVDARTDVHALGVMLYEILTGSLPFRGRTAVEVYTKIVREEPARPSSLNRTIARDVEIICLKAMSKEKNRRYRNATEFAEDLGRFRRGEPIRARPPSVFFLLRRKLARQPVLVAASIAALAGAFTTAVTVGQVVRRREFDRSRDSAQRAFAEGEWGRAMVECDRALGIRPDPALEGIREESRARLRTVEAEEEGRRRYLAFQGEWIPRLQAKIEKSRTMFYIPNANVRAHLEELEKALLEFESFAADPAFRSHSEVWATIGMGWYVLGDLARAEEALLEAAHRSPDDARVAAYLGRVYLDRSLIARLRDSEDPSPNSEIHKMLAQASRHFRRAIRGWEGATPIELHLARIHQSEDDQHHQNCRLAREGVETFGDAPGVEEFWVALAMLRHGSDRDPIVDLTKAVQIRPYAPWLFLFRGELYHEGGRNREALTDYGKSIEQDPRLYWAYTGRGVLHHQMGRWEEAISDFTAALHIRPGFSMAYAGRASARLERGDSIGALQDLEEALRFNPDYVPAYTKRARLRALLKDHAGAFLDATLALHRQPRNRYALAIRARTRVRLGDLRGALTDFAEAIESDPADPDLYHDAGLVRRGLGDFSGALRDFTGALRLRPSSARMWCLRAGTWKRQGNLDRTWTDANQSLAWNPRTAEAWFLRGYVRASRRDFSGALFDLNRAIEVDPSGADVAWLERAWVRMTIGDPRGALLDCNEAVNRRPRFAEGWIRRGFVWIALEEEDAARADFIRALSLDPRNRQARQALDQLNRKSGHR